MGARGSKGKTLDPRRREELTNNNRERTRLEGELTHAPETDVARLREAIRANVDRGTQIIIDGLGLETQISAGRIRELLDNPVTSQVPVVRNGRVENCIGCSPTELASLQEIVTFMETAGRPISEYIGDTGLRVGDPITRDVVATIERNTKAKFDRDFASDPAKGSKWETIRKWIAMLFPLGSIVIYAGIAYGVWVVFCNLAESDSGCFAVDVDSGDTEKLEGCVPGDFCDGCKGPNAGGRQKCIDCVKKKSATGLDAILKCKTPLNVLLDTIDKVLGLATEVVGWLQKLIDFLLEYGIYFAIGIAVIIALVVAVYLYRFFRGTPTT